MQLQKPYPKYAYWPSITTERRILRPVGRVRMPATVMLPLLIFATLPGLSSVPQMLKSPYKTPLKMELAPETVRVVTLDGGSVLISILRTRAGLSHALTCGSMRDEMDVGMVVEI